MIENREYKLTKGPKIMMETIICDQCGFSEPLEVAPNDKWIKVDDIKSSAGLNAVTFDSKECMFQYFGA